MNAALVYTKKYPKPGSWKQADMVTSKTSACLTSKLTATRIMPNLKNDEKPQRSESQTMLFKYRHCQKALHAISESIDHLYLRSPLGGFHLHSTWFCIMPHDNTVSSVQMTMTTFTALNVAVLNIGKYKHILSS